jgi:hypothetical protein
MRLIAGALVCAFMSCGSMTDEEAYSKLHSDSGIRGRPYNEIIADIQSIADAHPDRAEFIEYGRTRNNRPMMVLKVWDKNLSIDTVRPAVAITEAIHGNEYLHIVDRMPSDILNNTTLATEELLTKGGVLYIVPIFNPDGYSANRRENAVGKDLNRDFVIQAVGNQGFTQPETKQYADYIAQEMQEQNLQLEATMEYHCCIGGLIHPWNYDVSRALQGDQRTRHFRIGAKVRELMGYPHGNVRDIVNYPFGAVGGSDDYFLEKYGRRAFSFEGISNGGEQHNYRKHLLMWDYIFNESAADYPRI